MRRTLTSDRLSHKRAIIAHLPALDHSNHCEIEQAARGEAMPKLKIAVAGAGLIGRTHIGLVQASGECELSGIVDPAPASAELARAAGVPRYETLGALFAQQRPDGVILATPNQL